ncbi:hypothetical protein HK102_006476 [Quaeritorhiza haematococci]|nr:hypothetical protein HK102_006476 [Quaeritorhiza haematococci]
MLRSTSTVSKSSAGSSGTDKHSERLRFSTRSTDNFTSNKQNQPQQHQTLTASFSGLLGSSRSGSDSSKPSLWKKSGTKGTIKQQPSILITGSSGNLPFGEEEEEDEDEDSDSESRSDNSSSGDESDSSDSSDSSDGSDGSESSDDGEGQDKAKQLGFSNIILPKSPSGLGAANAAGGVSNAGESKGNEASAAAASPNGEVASEQTQKEILGQQEQRPRPSFADQDVRKSTVLPPQRVTAQQAPPTSNPAEGGGPPNPKPDRSKLRKRTISGRQRPQQPAAGTVLQFNVHTDSKAVVTKKLTGSQVSLLTKTVGGFNERRPKDDVYLQFLKGDVKKLKAVVPQRSTTSTRRSTITTTTKPNAAASTEAGKGAAAGGGGKGIVKFAKDTNYLTVDRPPSAGFQLKINREFMQANDGEMAKLRRTNPTRFRRLLNKEAARIALVRKLEVLEELRMSIIARLHALKYYHSSLELLKEENAALKEKHAKTIQDVNEKISGMMASIEHEDINITHQRQQLLKTRKQLRVKEKGFERDMFAEIEVWNEHVEKLETQKMKLDEDYDRLVKFKMTYQTDPAALSRELQQHLQTRDSTIKHLAHTLEVAEKTANEELEIMEREALIADVSPVLDIKIPPNASEALRRAITTNRRLIYEVEAHQKHHDLLKQEIEVLEERVRTAKKELEGKSSFVGTGDGSALAKKAEKRGSVSAGSTLSGSLSGSAVGGLRSSRCDSRSSASASGGGLGSSSKSRKSSLAVLGEGEKGELSATVDPSVGPELDRVFDGPTRQSVAICT